MLSVSLIRLLVRQDVTHANGGAHLHHQATAYL